MAIIQLKNIFKQFSGDFILKNISFSIENKDKIGLVGLNGTGKSTLIRILLNMDTYAQNEKNESGEITKASGLKIGYLSQEYNFSDEKNTVYEEMLSVFSEELEIWKKIQKNNMRLAMADSNEIEKILEESEKLNIEYEMKNGYEIEYKIKQILTGLEVGIEYYDRVLEKLSGGEKARVEFMKLILAKPNFLIFDEPTNHLDMESITSLNDAMTKFIGNIIFTSHDHQLTQTVANRIIDLKADGTLIDREITYNEYLNIE